MTQLQAVVAALVAFGLIVAAVVGLAGPFWGMLTAGVLVAVAVVLLYDAEAGKKQ